MKTATEKMMNVLSRMTNLELSMDGDHAVWKTGDSKRVDLTTLEASATELVAVNVLSGTYSVRPVRLEGKRVDGDKLAKAVQHEWSKLQRSTLAELNSTFCESGIDSDESRASLSEETLLKLDVFCVRLVEALAFFGVRMQDTEPNVPFARTLVRAIAGAKVDSYDGDVRGAYILVESELERLWSAESGLRDLNVKVLRERLAALGQNIWTPVEGIILPRVFKCSDSLAREVYSRFYGGRKLDGNGKVVQTRTDGGKVLAEVVLALLGLAQTETTTTDDAPAK